MAKKVVYFLVIFLAFLSTSYTFLYADDEERQNDYKELRDINIGTFNEYGYRITEQFFKLKQEFEVDGSFGSNTLTSLEKLVLEGYRYLPDNLNNKNLLNDVQSAIKKGQKTNNELIYIEISRSIEKYLYNSEIQKIKGTIEANPTSGNAPLNVTLRAKVDDPTGTIIPKDNYIWWIDDALKKKIIGKGLSLNYTLNNEGRFSIFLDVISSHRNGSNYIDVLPFRSRSEIDVKQKIANISIKVNFNDLGNQNTIKLSPEDGDYGIVFDATSSIPTSGSTFLKTSWDFGNGVKREYDGGPRVERIVYSNKGEYNVTLKLKTNELNEVERKFVISINNPIATIVASQDQGFIGDRFTFSAKTTTTDKNVNYNWEVVDIDKNVTILEKAGNLFTYEFSKKGKYNVKLKVISPSGEIDNDNKIIYINSRAPIADFVSNIPKSSSPNRVLFDATRSYDEDFSDDGNLDYAWEIDGQRIELENPSFHGAIGYYTFDSVGDHSVILEVTDPDGIKSLKRDRVKIDSILSVNFDAYPLVIKRNSVIKFVADSKEAEFYRWDFGDLNNEGTKNNEISHAFTKSGVFSVKLEVSDEDSNTNTFSKNVYVSDSDYPYALIEVTHENGFNLPFDSTLCDGKGAYSIDRVDNIKFSGQKSINTDGGANGISYSWKIGQENVSSSATIIKKFDEIGCFPVKLSVKSEKNDKIHSVETYVKVKNILPSMTSLSVQTVNSSTDPIIVNLKAIGDKDKDGVILSYLWYYYTNSDEEPQDYRVTVRPETTFVLPKISGTYYFVLTLKDNNEEKFSSESLGTKFYVTLVGDNVNTPLLDLTVNDSSVSVGETVEFTTKIKNVLGNDLTSKATYSWDFNGDGFYDKEIIGNGTVTHKFETSGTYYVKVKAKYKGISNVKTITIDVTNTLVPDFDYISIFNKTIFLNKSLGNYDDISWDLGDGSISDSKDSFIHTYHDGINIHKVTLRISEGNKYKEFKKSVVKNNKNLIKANQKGLNIFSKPEITTGGGIILKERNEKVFIYLGESKLGKIKYVIDYDINYDSDLNGGKADDEDNRDTPSYKDGSPVEIKLNESKYQTFKITIFDLSDKELVKKEIKITKEYITEEKKESDIIFPGVSKSDEAKLQALKNYISKFPEPYKSASMKYLERLKAEWFDETEKTKVILEFEGYIDNPDITNSADIINLLESILVSGEEDKSQKNIAYNALKNLLLNDIYCEYDTKTFKSCKEYLVSILEQIKNSTDIDKNKELGKIVLTVVASDSIMTKTEKEDFKEILKILINGENSKEEGTVTPNKNESKGFFATILGFLKGLAMFIMVIILIIGIMILVFWMYFKFMFKDNSKSFEEFIIDKTKFIKGDNDLDTGGKIQKDTKNDIVDIVKDPFSIESLDDIKIEEESGSKEETIPDWLKASFEQNEPKEEIKTEDKKVNEMKRQEVKKEEVKTENKKVDEVKTEKITNNNNNFNLSLNIEENDTDSLNLDDNLDDIPDWLKQTDDEDNLLSKPEIKQDIENNENESDSNSEMDDITKIDEPVIPDWLKASITEDVNKDATDDITSNGVNSSSPNKDEEEPIIVDETKPGDDYEDLIQTDLDSTNDDNTVIPDWLKQPSPEKNEEDSTIVDETKSGDDYEDLIQTDLDSTNDDNLVIPDWLNQPSPKDEKDLESIDNTRSGSEYEDLINIDLEEEDTLIPDWLKSSIKEGESKKQDKKTSDPKTSDPKVSDPKTKTIVTKDNKNLEKDKKVKNDIDNSQTKINGEELWHDGMDVPDWLNEAKNDDDK